MGLNGLTTVNIEMTSRCQKKCFMCGRRKLELDHPNLVNWGDMDYEMVKSISGQLPEGIVVQFHDNGEPLLYPYFGEAVALFENQIRCMDTNGKLLLEKANEIIGNMDTITISTFEGDEEADEQYRIISEFLEIKGVRKPNVIIRCLGDMDVERYEKLGCIVASRVLHSPYGSYQYKKPPTIPEIGICLDALSHLVIKRTGEVSMCVRFDPEGLGVIGDLKTQSLENIWNGEDRKLRLKCHIKGERHLIPLCSKCEYWGCPTG